MSSRVLVQCVQGRGFKLPLHTFSMMTHVCKLNLLDVETGGSRIIQGHSQLHREFKASLGYINPCQRERETESEGQEDFLGIKGIYDKGLGDRDREEVRELAATLWFLNQTHLAYSSCPYFSLRSLSAP